MAIYAFDNAKTAQRERLRALEATLDPGTIGHLSAIGVASGWRCLEVGAGGGSVAAWLADRVGCGGEVLATDLDVTVARERVHGGLSVQVHDVLVDPLPESRFDLVHARLLLAWLPQRQRALARLVRTLKPGGWLLVEEMDFASVVPAGLGGVADVQAFSRVLETHLVVLRTHNGFDSHYGRHLLRDLLAAGLEAVKAEGRASVWRGGGDGMRIWRLTFAQLRDAMVAAGLPGGDVDRAIELSDDPGFAFVAPLVMAASGRRSAR